MTSIAETLGHSLDRSSHFRARRLGHVDLLRVNLVNVSAFNRDIAGAGVHHRQGERGFSYTNGNTHHDLELLDARSAVRSRPNHLAFELEAGPSLADAPARFGHV
ncbi:hypothetical protein [Embleya sp. NPDC059259]|uniref:hypothetical protein n=1 Tax=unclassified Embleya TaxID=2699296 RepID=UPI0036C955F7